MGGKRETKKKNETAISLSRHESGFKRETNLDLKRDFATQPEQSQPVRQQTLVRAPTNTQRDLGGTLEHSNTPST